jgi:hypothetical protein
LSNAAFASRSTRCPFCFSSVNILYASSTGRAAFKDVGIGLKIGNINVNNTGCADNIALLSTQLSDAQIMVNMALDFANLEGYELQPKKSVAIHIEKYKMSILLFVG